MSTNNEPAVQAANGKKWAAILGGVAVILTATVPPIVSVLRHAPNVSADRGSVAVGGNVNVSTTINNSFGDVWLDGARTIVGLGPRAAKPSAAEIPSVAPQAAVAIEPPAANASSTQPMGGVAPAPIFPKYEDKYLRAIGMTSSLGNNGANTIIPVKIENKTESDLLIGHDMEVVTAIANTGETNTNTGGCNLSGIRSFAVGDQRKPYDPLVFSTVAPGGTVTLQVGCSLGIADPIKVNQLNVNIPLVRLDGETIRRFTLNIADIPTSK